MAAIATKKKSRVRMGVPQGNILDLKGLDAIRGFGDDMSIPNMRGDIQIDQSYPSQVEAPGGPLPGAKIEHISGKSLLTDRGSGKSQVLVQPLFLNGVLLNGVPSPSEEMGVILGERRYFFNIALQRADGGTWSPMRGAPAQFGYHVIDASGVQQPPDIVKKVFELLLRAAELYYRSCYRDFVLAELAWFNNSILEYEESAEKVRLKQASDEESSSFYLARFSGKMKTIREGEARLLDWLEQHPAA